MTTQIPPETRFARSGEVHIAYQVVGAGALDVVLVPGWVSHLEHAWEEPSFAAFLRGIAAFSRRILIDRRGTGLSDRIASLPTRAPDPSERMIQKENPGEGSHEWAKVGENLSGRGTSRLHCQPLVS